MIGLKFTWILIRPWLAPLALIPLLLVWIVLEVALGITHAWQEAKS